MTRFTIAATLALAAAFPAAAHATLLTRTFVSSAGSNSNPCTITQPCASFATAYGLTAPNGIVAALDPGKYGPLTITGPITINGYGWASITAPANGSGITINAASTDGITLTGLAIDGAGAISNGIVFNIGGSLTVTDCVAQNFSGTGLNGNGILMAPTSGTISFTITNTTVSKNGSRGIYYLPQSGSATANGIIEHVMALNNSVGIEINISSGGGSTTAAIANSVASNNGTDGISISSVATSLALSIDNTSVTGNVNNGISATGPVNVTLGRSVIIANGVGIHNMTLPNAFFTYGNNGINGNTDDIDHSLDGVTRKLR